MVTSEATPAISAASVGRDAATRSCAGTAVGSVVAGGKNVKEGGSEGE